MKISNQETRDLDKQRGAAEARRAHNPEDPGSKPGVARFLIFSIVLIFFGSYGDLRIQHPVPYPAFVISVLNLI